MPQTICEAEFCTEIFEENGQSFLPKADLCIVLVSSGSAALSAINDDAHLLCAGGIFLSKGEVEVIPATDCHLLAIGLKGIATKYASEKIETAIISDASTCPLAGQTMAQIHEAMQNSSSAILQSELCYRLICNLAMADEQVSSAKLPILVTQAVIAIKQNYGDLYGVDELSAQLGVSKSHLVRVFSGAMGVSPGKYLTSVRITAAKQLLEEREYSLEIIASLCGFSGANYFCKVFKKETGITPAAHRSLFGNSNIQFEAVNELERALYI